MLSLLDDVHPQWRTALAPVEQVVTSIEHFLADRNFLPAAADIMAAFRRPLSEVRVLIVGQDPYPTPGHAMGLAFSVAAGVEPPRSLSNIFTELSADTGCAKPASGDLTPWSDQGVMLLNRVLTVDAGIAGSHHGKGWEEVTDCAIEALVARGTPLVAVLWGRQAQSLVPRLGSTPTVMSAHPSPLSARHGFFGSAPFSHVNALLAQQGANPIHWCLP